jgi:DNA-binding transcriptional regulator YiaG
MNEGLFGDMIAGFDEAKKYRAGRKSKLRVSRLAFKPIKMKPAQIRQIRIRPQLNQPEFADFLCSSVGAIRSWEQGSRTPNRTALRLLVIAKEKPALLFAKTRLAGKLETSAPSKTREAAPTRKF